MDQLRRGGNVVNPCRLVLSRADAAEPCCPPNSIDGNAGRCREPDVLAGFRSDCILMAIWRRRECASIRPNAGFGIDLSVDLRTLFGFFALVVS